MLDVGVGHRFQSPRPAGVVDQHIDPVQAIGQRVHRVKISDVRHNRGAADLGGQGLDRLGRRAAQTT